MMNTSIYSQLSAPMNSGRMKKNVTQIITPANTSLYFTSRCTKQANTECLQLCMCMVP